MTDEERKAFGVVHTEIQDAIVVAGAVSEAEAKLIVIAIVTKEIPYVRVEY